MTGTGIPEDVHRMMAQLDLDAFTPGLKSIVRIPTNLGVIHLELVEATRLAYASPDIWKFRDPFRLLLKGPLHPQLPSGSYLTELPKLGRVVLFLSPVIGADPNFSWYESVWS